MDIVDKIRLKYNLQEEITEKQLIIWYSKSTIYSEVLELDIEEASLRAIQETCVSPIKQEKY